MKVYTSPNGKETSQVLPAGTRWKVFRELNNGELWMQLGSNQWVNTASNVAK
ncbi:hypothetical protein FC23_GL000623 [Lactobacillus psittaci DSM 15354]|uniref:Surface layer protein A domain-containing protein n=1 Tax=Lactobacillus psittaci DSM 15354 TaxID=1122152 RepID=A0A0R1RZJ4_9LACO|nr:hypothetical protein FC23_GL000623 [Lactobacillus psittaci DSM 15354]